MKVLRNCFRILIGLVFIFSSFVKGVDPLGTAFRIEDYFVAFGIPWAGQFALGIAIVMCMLEFITGISLLLNLWIKKSAWLLLLLMTYFTVLTFIDAIWNLVPDCGCFGDAIKLTNVQTFLKNLVLMVFVVPIFMWRKKYRSAHTLPFDIALLSLAAFAFIWMSVYSVRHLPLIDFMAWGRGNKVNKSESLPVKFFVTYKNKMTGEKKEYLASNYPWNDTVWMSQWVFESQRVEDPNAEKSAGLLVEDMQGNDVTASILQKTDYQFLLIIYNLKETNTEALLRILPFYKKAQASGISFICITSAMPAEVRKFRFAHGTAFEFYNADDVILKTMVRSNPGLILLKDGVVINKWAFRDFPDWNLVSEKYFK
ncbi:MAG: DoxX family protein [Bacteroidetes bacterium]|nr:DoxX family protein [Bacteroidota bacterium]